MHVLISHLKNCSILYCNRYIIESPWLVFHRSWLFNRLFTFKDVNTLCVWGIFVWVIGRSEEASFWFLHPRTALTCRFHSRVVFHWNIHNKQREKRGKIWRKWYFWRNNMWLLWLRSPAESLLVAPDNPSRRRLATTGGTQRQMHYRMKTVICTG